MHGEGTELEGTGYVLLSVSLHNLLNEPVETDESVNRGTRNYISEHSSRLTPHFLAYGLYLVRTRDLSSVG